MTTNNTSPDDTDLTRRSLEECTPGEWRVEDDGDLYIVTGVDRDVARVDVGDEHTATPRQIADAWLMAQGKAHAAEVLRLRMELHGAQHALEEASRERVRAALRAEAAERERDAATARVAALTKDRDDNVDELVNCLAEREDDRRQASDALGHLRIRAEIAETERAAARRECDALRAIVEGRTAPPTIREARQHSHVTRGAFVAVLGSSPAHLSARIATGLQRFDVTPQLWIALGADGRPCAWPVVDGVPR